MRRRVSTTVDADLLRQARSTAPDSTDAALFDRALRSLLADLRRTTIDEAYETAYLTHPVDVTDEWGDLASFNAAAHRARVGA